jgi:hypothetical protein
VSRHSPQSTTDRTRARPSPREQNGSIP